MQEKIDWLDFFKHLPLVPLMFFWLSGYDWFMTIMCSLGLLVFGSLFYWLVRFSETRVGEVSFSILIFLGVIILLIAMPLAILGLYDPNTCCQ